MLYYIAPENKEEGMCMCGWPSGGGRDDLPRNRQQRQTALFAAPDFWFLLWLFHAPSSLFFMGLVASSALVNLRYSPRQKKDSIAFFFYSNRNRKLLFN